MTDQIVKKHIKHPFIWNMEGWSKQHMVEKVKMIPLYRQSRLRLC